MLMWRTGGVVLFGGCSDRVDERRSGSVEWIFQDRVHLMVIQARERRDVGVIL